MIGSPAVVFGALSARGQGEARAGGGASPTQAAQGNRQGPDQKAMDPVPELDLILVGGLGSRPARTKPASDVAAKPEARERGQDDVEAGEDGQRDRSVPPGW